MKNKFEDYTEIEFLDFLKDFCSSPKNLTNEEFGRRRDKMLKHFEKVTEHPGGSDVIFYPEEDQEDSPEGMLKTVKQWREQNGKPGFKPADNT